ncbi:MAG: OB-fold domain-containing protein [Faecalibacterium prausnitzii]
MIYCLTGKIVKKSLNAVVLSCGGVGYYTQCPASVAGALPGVGQETTLLHRDERDRERCKPVRLCHRGAAGLL